MGFCTDMICTEDDKYLAPYIVEVMEECIGMRVHDMKEYVVEEILNSNIFSPLDIPTKAMCYISRKFFDSDEHVKYIGIRSSITLITGFASESAIFTEELYECVLGRCKEMIR